MLKDIATKYSECFTDSGFQSLRAYLGRVRSGSDLVVETPFAKGESTEDMLASWNDVLVSLQDQWPGLYDYEQDMREKVGPLSVMKPLKERIPSIKEYYSDIHLQSSPILDKAVKAVQSEFRAIRGLRARSLVNTVNNMKLSTNSGAPLFRKRRDVPTKYLDQLSFTEFHGVPCPMIDVDSHVYNLPAVIGWRGQEGGYSKDDVKQRVVWMFPFTVNLYELRVYQPFIEGCQRHGLVPAWISMDEVDRKVTLLFDTKGKEDLVICTDFSRFDQHFNTDLQHAARDIFSYTITDQQWLEDVFPIKYNIPIVVNNEHENLIIYGGEHGMGSGSGGTNADETVSHRALQYEAALLNGERLNPNSQCLGDDGILSYPGITVDQVVRAYTSHGQECNKDKQSASATECVYLRRWHHTDYRINNICAGVYPTMRALGRLRYMERFYDPKIWGKEAVALRELSILENVKFHPLREEFAQFCMARDKYRLGLDIPGFLDGLESQVRKFNDYIPDFIGYTKSQQKQVGIASWWIVNYLKSKR